MDALILTVTQQVTFQVAYVDSQGNPARVDGVPVWASSDTTLLTLEAEPDGFSALATAVGSVGDGIQVSVTADADLGTGMRPIVTLGTVNIIAGEAVAGMMTAGTPEEQA